MIKSSIHHFDGFVGLVGNGGGSGKEGGRAPVCSASLVGAGIDPVETTFGVVSTISGGSSGSQMAASPTREEASVSISLLLIRSHSKKPHAPPHAQYPFRLSLHRRAAI
jgi:hypothetical protein